jgi:hypothetical protein
MKTVAHCGFSAVPSRQFLMVKIRMQTLLIVAALSCAGCATAGKSNGTAAIDDQIRPSYSGPQFSAQGAGGLIPVGLYVMGNALLGKSSPAKTEPIDLRSE